MKKTIYLLLSMTTIIAIVIVSCEQKETKSDAKTDTTARTISDDSLVKRGGYIVSFSGCDDCHTPKKMGPNGPEPDMDRRLSGHPANEPLPPIDTNHIRKGWASTNMGLTGWVGPWGASFSANITSDETGIGSWTEEQFKKAFTQGKWKGMDNGRMLLPPMPWWEFANLTDEDVRAVFLFLKSTKPISNITPPVRAFADLK